MNDKKVVILLSAYNGEKYIKEQIESLLNQTYKNIEIIIRDDGSKDNTLKVLDDYKNNDTITIIKGKNIGFVKSFFELIKICDNAEYYAFCDQDDVWFENKIEVAINKLEEKNKDNLLLYASDYDFYDENMNFSGHSQFNKKIKKPGFEKSLIECISPGMTMIFNKKLRDFVLQNIPEKACFHDWWIYEVASAFGEVIYDNNVTVKYRRHSKNTSEEELGIIKKIIKTIKNRSFNKLWKKLKVQLIEFEKIYGKELTQNQLDELQLFTNEKFIISKYLKKVFFCKRFQDKLKDELLIRIIFILNII